MRNVKIWRQGTFSGGINTASPPTQLEESQLADILNMFPNDKGSELMLRSAFLENIATADEPAYDHLFAMRTIVSTGAVVDGLIGAILAGANVEAYSILPSPYTLDTDESGYDSGLPGGGGGWVPPPVVPPNIQASMTTWDAIQTEVYKNDIDPANDIFTGAWDFWVDTNGYLAAGIEGQKNLSDWPASSYTYDPVTDAATFYPLWYQAADSGKKIACDTWYDPNSTLNVFADVDGVAPQKFLGVGCPWWRQDLVISGGGSTRNPNMVPPTVEFTATVPTNSSMSFCFDYDTNYTGISVQVFVKNNKDATAQWSPVNLKGATQVPLVLIDQSGLAEGERFQGTGDLDEFIVCSKVIPYPDVAVKMEFIPSRIDADNPAVGGLFIGYYIAAA